MVKDAVKGILLAFVASYTSVVVLGLCSWGYRRPPYQESETIQELLGSTFVQGPLSDLWSGAALWISTGAALGVVVPRAIVGRTRTKATLIGAGLGAIAGIGVAIGLEVYSHLSAMGWSVLTVPYMSAWVACYARYRAQTT